MNKTDVSNGKGNCCYNTPMEISQLLVSLLPEQKYRRVIDICCGSWNLINAAYNRFLSGTFIGIDINGDCEKNKPTFAQFIKQDGRMFALNNIEKYDLILSNPPYGYLPDQTRLFNSLEGDRILNELKRKRYECEMIQANLLLGDENAVYLFILPVTILKGSTYLQFRNTMKERYEILSISELPTYAFGKQRISTFAVVIRNKRSRTKNYRKYVIKDNGLSYMLISVELDDVADKEKNINEKKRISKKDCQIHVYRGNISGNKIKEKKGKLVYHCSNKWKKGEWIPHCGLCSDQEKLKCCKRVKKGDILVNRIGKNAGAWCVAKRGGYVSDCIIAITSNEKDQLNKLCLEHSVKHIMKIPIKGVSVPYLTIGDIRKELEN